MLDIAINIYFTLLYYADIMLNAFNDQNYASIIGGSLLPTTLHPYMNACGIGYACENLFKMERNSASHPFNS